MGDNYLYYYRSKGTVPRKNTCQRSMVDDEGNSDNMHQMRKSSVTNYAVINYAIIIYSVINYSVINTMDLKAHAAHFLKIVRTSKKNVYASLNCAQFL